MKRPLSLRERRILALGLALSLVAVVYVVAIAPVARGFSDRSAQRELLTLQLHHNAATIRSVPQLRRQSAIQQAQLAGFAMSTNALSPARADLSRRLQSTVEAAGGDVRASEPKQAPPGWVGAQLTARMTLAEASIALARLQNDQPPATIDAFRILADANAVAATPGDLEISIEVSVPLVLLGAR